jgi:hypothetical protein
MRTRAFLTLLQKTFSNFLEKGGMMSIIPESPFGDFAALDRAELGRLKVLSGSPVVVGLPERYVI